MSGTQSFLVKSDFEKQNNSVSLLADYNIKRYLSCKTFHKDLNESLKSRSIIKKNCNFLRSLICLNGDTKEKNDEDYSCEE